MAKEGKSVLYRDVIQDAQAMKDMVALTKGERRVPVMVQGDQVSIGFGGT